MKKYFYLATALVALAACSNEEYVGDNSPTLGEGNGAIGFSMNVPNATRADKVAADAAEILQSQFIVYGTKHENAEAATAANDEVVFKNYKVEYTANTAGTKSSNTNNWDYVGLTPYDAEKVSPAATSQTIKYWDYSAANGYTFYGIASKADIATNNKITIAKTTTGTTVYDKGYSVTIKSGADLEKLFVADRKTVATGDYNKPVTLTFRNFASRVRVGFYETIPGYTVTINKFYYDTDAAAAVTSFTPMTDANETNFAASLQNIKVEPATSNTLAVTYYNGTDGPENQVKLAATTVESSYTLTLGAGVVGTVLGTSAASPTWDKNDTSDPNPVNYKFGLYNVVYPLEANTNPMLMKVDYTLTAEDGSGETIKVLGANVVVPAQYVKWKSNFAYTYLFKISDNTNGTTDGSTQGLYPITFDAIAVAVVDDKTQETITNFEDYSITTYANGSEVKTNNEYKVGEDIYVVKMNNAANPPVVVVPSAIGNATGNADVYKVSSTGDAISEATIKAKLTGSPNGISLTALAEAATRVSDGKVPAADNTKYEFTANGVVKFTPDATGTYVYVFTRTAYVAPTYSADGAYSSAEYVAKTYYFKTSEGVYYVADGINADNFNTYRANLYTKEADGTAGVYDIKIIKVGAGS